MYCHLSPISQTIQDEQDMVGIAGSDSLLWTSVHGHTSVDRPPKIYIYGGARGVVVIAVGNGHGDTSSNPGRD